MKPASAYEIDGRVDLAEAAPAAGRRTGTSGRYVVLAGFIAYAALVGLGWQLLSRFVPDQVTLHALGRSATVHNVRHRILGDATLAFLVLPSALWIECLAVGWQRSSVRQFLAGPTASMKTDLAFFVLGQGHVMDLLGRIMMLGASMISGAWIRDSLAAATGLRIDPSALPVLAQVPVYFAAYTFFDYWTHRIDHSRLLWPLHRYHHAATDFCVVNAARAHPAAFTGVFVVNLPMAVLGASPEVMVYVNVATISLGFLIHSRIDSNWGWIGRWVIQSPTHHRLHHKLDMSGATGHFAMAPVWDHLFGTWRGEADQSLPIGVDTPYRHGFWIVPDLLRDYWHLWKGLLGGRNDGPAARDAA